MHEGLVDRYPLRCYGKRTNLIFGFTFKKMEG